MEKSIFNLFVLFLLMSFSSLNAQDQDSVAIKNDINTATEDTVSVDTVNESERIEKAEQAESDYLNKADKLVAEEKAAKESVKAAKAERNAIRAEQKAIKAQRKAEKAKRKAEKQQRKLEKARRNLN